MKKISIIGAGKLGKTIARLFYENKVYDIQDILCSNVESANIAKSFIGDGRVINSIEDINHVDIFLISTPDDLIEKIGSKIISRFPDAIFFHTSGALSSKILKTRYSCSVHPIHSFANPESSVKYFNGTMCGVEGNEKALKELSIAFKKIGGKIFNIDSDKKELYHSATVIACNYFVVLENISSKILSDCGIGKKEINQILAPILQGTLNNIIQKGTMESLTGPVARGDYNIIEKHIQSLTNYNKNFADIYKLLATQAVDIAYKQGKAKKKNLNKIIELLRN